MPTLLTDYILKGICSPCASLLHPSCILHAVPVKSLSPLCIHCGFLLHILVHPFCILVQLPRILHAPPVHPCASPMHLVCILHASPCIPCALSVHPLCILCESCVHLLCIPHASFVQALCILTHLCRSLHLPWTSLIPCYVVHPLPSCSLTNPCAPPSPLTHHRAFLLHPHSSSTHLLGTPPASPGHPCASLCISHTVLIHLLCSLPHPSCTIVHALCIPPASSLHPISSYRAASRSTHACLCTHVPSRTLMRPFCTLWNPHACLCVCAYSCTLVHPRAHFCILLQPSCTLMHRRTPLHARVSSRSFAYPRASLRILVCSCIIVHRRAAPCMLVHPCAHPCIIVHPGATPHTSLVRSRARQCTPMTSLFAVLCPT